MRASERMRVPADAARAQTTSPRAMITAFKDGALAAMCTCSAKHKHVLGSLQVAQWVVSKYSAVS